MNIADFKSKVQETGVVTLIGPMKLENIPRRNGGYLFVDGGFNHIPKEFDTPYFSVGDGDSSQPDQKLGIRWDPEKDFSDFSGALRLCQEAKSIFCIGFLGGRRDHELANYGEVHQFLKETQIPKVVFFSSVLGFQVNAYSKGTHEINIGTGPFSLFTLDSCSIDLTGKCQYQSEKGQLFLPLGSRGLSNFATGSFQVESEGPFFIFWEPERAAL